MKYSIAHYTRVAENKHCLKQDEMYRTEQQCISYRRYQTNKKRCSNLYKRANNFSVKSKLQKCIL